MKKTDNLMDQKSMCFIFCYLLLYFVHVSYQDGHNAKVKDQLITQLSEKFSDAYSPIRIKSMVIFYIIYLVACRLCCSL